MVKGKKKGIRMIAEMKRLKNLGFSNKAICRSLKISKNTLKKHLAENPNPPSSPPLYVAPWADKIDWNDVHKQTSDGLALAHYHENNVVDKLPEIPYTSFWREYKRRYPQIPVSYHKSHPPGERCEIDYKGTKNTEFLGFYDRSTKLFVPCRLFGSVLSFSQILFVRATLSEKQKDWLDSTSKSYEYFGGVPASTATDNAKALVTIADRYDAEINPEFMHFARHYNTAPIAMRPRKPKDKNVIEGSFGVFWRWITPRLKHKKFYSLAELNLYLLQELEVFNNRVQKKYGMSRYQKFLSAEKQKLAPLPDDHFDCGDWKESKVHPDCHIQVEKNFYSVPYKYVGKSVDVRISTGFIEIFSNLERLACHHKQAKSTSGRYATNKDHWPPRFSEISLSSPRYWLEKASEIGQFTEVIVKRLLNEAIHPLQNLRAIQGIIRLADRYSKIKLEKGCEFFSKRNYSELRLRNIEAVIKNNATIPPPEQPVKRLPNDNLRGQSHWAIETKIH